MLSDPRLFSPRNIAKGYNIWTGRGEESTTYGEIHTGTKWKEAVDHYIGNDHPERFAIGLYVFIDETHTDLKDGMKATPVLIGITWFNLETRKKSYAMFPIGFLPNLKFGKSKSYNKDTCAGLQDEHDCLTEIFQQLIDIAKSPKRGFDLEILGESVVAVPWVHFVIGDCKGIIPLVGGFNENGGKCQRPHPMCKCNDLANTDVKCVLVTLEELEEIKEEASLLCKTSAEALLRTVSRHRVETVFDRGVPLGDVIHGINLICPPEVLHVLGVGLCKYILEVISLSLDDKTKELLDKYHAEVYFDLKRNCDRDYYESSVNKGATDSTRQGAIENIGNLLAILCLAKSSAGHEVFFNNDVGMGGSVDVDGEMEVQVMNGKFDCNEMVEPLIVLLSSIGWFHNSNPKEEVETARLNLKDAIDDVIDRFPRTKGQGFAIPKVHSYLVFWRFMCYYGNAHNFYSGWGERAHIEYVKDNAKTTQRHADTFLQQMSHRVEERSILQTAEDNMLQQFSHMISEMNSKNSLRRKQIEMEEFSTEVNDEDVSHVKFVNSHKGGYTLTLELKGDVEAIRQHELREDDKECKIHHNIVWNSHNLEKSARGRGLCFETVLFLARRGLKHNRKDIFIRGYTETCVKFPTLPHHTIIRCSDDYGGKAWYDFVAVSIDNCVVPAKVIAILTINGIEKFLVHTAELTETDYNCLDRLQEKFILNFVLGGFDSIRIVDVGMLVQPLIVYPDYGMNDKKHFNALLPKRSWAKHFSNIIRNSNHFIPQNRETV